MAAQTPPPPSVPIRPGQAGCHRGEGHWPGGCHSTSTLHPWGWRSPPTSHCHRSEPEGPGGSCARDGAPLGPPPGLPLGGRQAPAVPSHPARHTAAEGGWAPASEAAPLGAPAGMCGGGGVWGGISRSPRSPRCPLLPSRPFVPPPSPAQERPGAGGSPEGVRIGCPPRTATPGAAGGGGPPPCPALPFPSPAAGSRRWFQLRSERRWGLFSRQPGLLPLTTKARVTGEGEPGGRTAAGPGRPAPGPPGPPQAAAGRGARHPPPPATATPGVFQIPPAGPGPPRCVPVLLALSRMPPACPGSPQCVPVTPPRRGVYQSLPVCPSRLLLCAGAPWCVPDRPGTSHSPSAPPPQCVPSAPGASQSPAVCPGPPGGPAPPLTPLPRFWGQRCPSLWPRRGGGRGMWDVPCTPPG